MTRTVRAALLAAAAVVAAVAIPADAHAAELCSDFGGTVGQGDVCLVDKTEPNYTLTMSFPVDFPDQAAVDDFLVQSRTGFLNEADTPGMRNAPYAMDLEGRLWATDTTRSVSFEVYQFLGGAHPDTWYKSFNYDTVRDRPIALGDLFGQGVDPVDAVYPVIQKKLEAELGSTPPTVAADAMDPTYYQNFAITPTDVVFFLDRGGLMVGAAGAHTVYVPRDAIPPLAV